MIKKNCRGNGTGKALTETMQPEEEQSRGFRASVNKKSFELKYNNGTIWCEHLDGMGNHGQKVIDKFESDMPVFLRPSVSSSMIINLDETCVTDAVRDAIVNNLSEAEKKFRKIAFVGVDRKDRPGFNTIHNCTGAVLQYFDDYEKAKEWVL